MASRRLQALLVTLATLMLAATVAVNYLSTSDLGVKLGLFSNDSRIPFNRRPNVTDSSISPPGWAFSIWGLIYAYQLVMVAYNISLLFRRGADGEWLCCQQGLLAPGLLACYAASSLFNVAWIIITDRVDKEKALFVPQAIAIFGLGISLWLGLAFAAQQLALGAREIKQRGLQREYWLCIALQHNAVGLYAGWLVIACFLNVDIANINLTDMSLSNSALLTLCQLCAVLCAYIVCDLLLLDPQLRFLFSPYLSLIWALCSSLSKNYVAGSATSIVCIELAVVLVVTLLAKIVLCVVRQIRCPQPSNSDGIYSLEQDRNSFKFGQL